MTAVPSTPVSSLHKDDRSPPFRRVLVANRGEIALRIIRACRDAGVEAVGVYSDADAASRVVRLADAAVRIGPAPAADSYLRAEGLIDAALSSGADALHPGYGFLSERASFATAVIDAGLAWIGPSPESIAAVGDKLAARRLAAAAGVPVVPGTLEPAVLRPDVADAFVADAERVGFPLLVKAAAGGGGRGMRRVTNAGELLAELAAGSAEASSAFGDGSVYLEREVRPARHVEVQLLGDREGRVVALGERDCSVQRRNQKLVEEAPAPRLSEEQRRELHAMAVRLGEAARLENAATAEFLFDTDGRFWFLEVNTRLQVEHGVTELVAGVDIVVEQLHVAAGRPLSERVLAAAARAAAPERHAIEVRLSAEDPSREFAPAPGRVGRWSMPSGPGIRVDTAIEPGDHVPPDYDPLIAKVLAVGENRRHAIARMRRALDEVEVSGIQTTLPFLRFVMDDEAFGAADLSTGFVAERWDASSHRQSALVKAAAIAAEMAAPEPPGAAAPEPGAIATPANGQPGGMSLRKDTVGARGWRQAGRRAATDRWPPR